MEVFAKLSFYQWVIFGTFIITLVPVLAGAIRYAQLSRGLRIFFWFMVVIFFLDGTGRVLWVNSISNLWIGHIHTVVEFAGLGWVYHYALRQRSTDRTMPVLIGSFTVLAIANTIFVQTMAFNNSYIKMLECLVLIGLSLAYFYRLSQQLSIERLETAPFFWINTAVLIYFSSSLFIFLCSNFILMYSRDLGVRIWFIHAIFYILYNLLAAVGLWIDRTK